MGKEERGKRKEERGKRKGGKLLFNDHRILVRLTMFCDL